MRVPTLCKVPVDLFKAYIAVQNLGGFINVSFFVIILVLHYGLTGASQQHANLPTVVQRAAVHTRVAAK